MFFTFVVARNNFHQKNIREHWRIDPFYLSLHQIVYRIAKHERVINNQKSKNVLPLLPVEAYKHKTFVTSL